MFCDGVVGCHASYSSFKDASCSYNVLEARGWHTLGSSYSVGGECGEGGGVSLIVGAAPVLHVL